MTAPNVSGPTTGRRGTVPTEARAVAGRLSALFAADCEIAARLGDAQRRHRQANERLWSGLAPDALALIDDGPAGASRIAALATATGPQAALQDVHWTIHRAFVDYQSACEQRRQLAVEVGELSVRLTDALCAAGWSAEEARRADVHQLARGGEPANDRGQRPR